MGGSPADGDNLAPAAPLSGDDDLATGPAATGTTGDDRQTPDGHVPVLVRRVDELLAPAIEAATRSGASDVVLVDATLGMAGHTLAMLTAHPELRVIGIDRDPQALRIAERRIESTPASPIGSNWCTPSTTGSAR